MTTLYIDYIKAVSKDYHTKKASNIIAPRLIHPTPGNLKDECLAVCKERFLKTDEPTLRTFFEQAADQKSYLKAINDFDINKFRPLVKFLKNKTFVTDPKNIELLAWLIDFTDRPFDSKKNYEEANTKLPVVKEERQNEKESKGEENDEKKGDKPIVQVLKRDTERPARVVPLPAKPKIISKIMAAAIILLILAPVIYLAITTGRGRSQGIALSGHESCMYWAGDHYQQISCSQKLSDTLIVALDSIKLNHFKKITQPDTITKNAIGYVWYAKINGSLELFTADGNHPVHQEYRLRPITLYMINKYIKSGAQSE